jgi:hypothetical protein
MPEQDHQLELPIGVQTQVQGETAGVPTTSSSPPPVFEQQMKDIIASAKAIGYADCINEVITHMGDLSGKCSNFRDYHLLLLDRLGKMLEERKDARSA